MILTVTLNPAIDITITLPELRSGTTHRIDPATRRAGGKGVNVARILTREGITTRVLAWVNDTVAVGAEFVEDLDRERVPRNLARSSAPLRSSITIVERESGRATVLNEPGQHPGEAAIQCLLAEVAAEPRLQCVVVSGSLPEDMSPATVADFVSAGSERGAPTVVDGSGAALLSAARAGASLLKPNAEELRSAVPAASDPLAAAHELIARGAGAVVVTLGEAGMVKVDAQGVLAARLPRALQGNPTGAGDAATAALAAGLAREGTLDEDTLRRAVAWSASAVLAPVAGELDPHWRDLLDEVEMQEVTEGSLRWSS